MKRIESVHRAMKILSLMLERGSVGVGEVAVELGVSPSTASRVLDTIAAEGFAMQGEQRRYVPGPQLLRAGREEVPPSLSERLHPYLEELYGLTQETVHLASLVGAEVHHHDYIEARNHTLVFTNRLTKQLPAHVTSEGKSMLAELSWDDVLSRYKQAIPLEEFSEEMPLLTKLRYQLSKVRRNGVATNFQESERGIAAMAASLGFVEGRLLSISVALPIVRFSNEVGHKLRRALLQVQARARRELGSF